MIALERRNETVGVSIKEGWKGHFLGQVTRGALHND
jgi:hypothetical protein